MTRTHRPFALTALWLCAAALLQAGTKARADLYVMAPATISGNINDNVIIYNPYHDPNPTVTITPTAHITGNVTIFNNCSVFSSGQISGAVATHTISYLKVTGGSMGRVSTYDTSGVSLEPPAQTPITLGGLDCYNSSHAAAKGQTLSANVHSINVKILYLHDQSSASMAAIDAPYGLWTEGSSYTGLSQSTIGFEVSAQASHTDLDTVYCSAGIQQFDSSVIYIYGGGTFMSTIVANGWADGVLPAGYNRGQIVIWAGTFNRGLKALGGEIDIYSCHIVNGPLYADPKAAYNAHSMYVYGHNLVVSSTGRLTGSVGGWPINVPCTGSVDLDSW